MIGTVDLFSGFRDKGSFLHAVVAGIFQDNAKIPFLAVSKYAVDARISLGKI